MIIPNQSNLKVHFACVEDLGQFMAAASAGVKYLLFTCYPLIADRFDFSPFKKLHGKTEEQVPAIIQSYSRHTIMDSGLFTLMFGSQAGGDRSPAFIERWLEEMVRFVQESQYTGTVVEVDCQKVLDVQWAWTLRERLRLALPDNRQINVFHIEDGYAGLDRLIEYTDYIAISVPELKILKRSKNNICQLANYIKNRKPEIDIHLLGCTDLELLRRLNFCSSSDSSSWVSGVRYGGIETMSGKTHISRLEGHELLDDHMVKIYDMAEAIGVEQKWVYYPRLSILSFAATQLKHIYAGAAGNQG